MRYCVRFVVEVFLLFEFGCIDIFYRCDFSFFE